MTGESPCHLCVTHSPLVTRVFEAAMRRQAAPAASIRSIARRGVAFPGEGVCLDDISDEMERCFRKYDRSGYRAAWRRFDASLRELTGGRSFEAYIPHANKILYQEIIGHPLCTAYSFLEEGFTSMAWDVQRNARSTPSKVLRNHFRTWWIRPGYRFGRPMFDHSPATYRAAFAISRHAFHGMPGRTDVSADLPPLPAGNPPGNTYLILDACYLHRGISWENYENALVAAVREHALPEGNLLIKFHFADSRADERFRSLQRRLTGSGAPPLSLLGGDFSVEERLTREDLLLFAVTSLGYYAALWGGRVKCFAREIQGVSIPAWIEEGRLPGDFPSVAGIPRDSL